MKLYGQLENAQIENKTSDYAAGVSGRIWFRTDSFKLKIDDGTNLYSLLRNDGYAVIGNNVTANNNIRFHRGAAGVLQLVQGGDSTAEGTLSTSLNQLSAKHEGYTNASKPSAGNAGRLIWVTDLGLAMIDTGAVWAPFSFTAPKSVKWIESDLSPLSGINNNILTYQYQATLGQSLYASIRIPSTYVAGNPITLRSLFYSADTSGNVLMQTVSTLIRTGTDAVSSTTNQRTSTNAATTLSGGTANIPQAATCDLTSSSGTINSVAVAAGDIINIKLTRGSDTATSDVYVPVNSSEVTFV